LETYAEVNTSHLKQRSFLHRLDYAFLSAFPRGFLLLRERVVIVFCPTLHRGIWNQPKFTHVASKQSGLFLIFGFMN
jgi:hypothetical protein